LLSNSRLLLLALGRAFSIKNNDDYLQELINHVTNDLKFKKEEYHSTVIKRVIINYRQIPAGWVKPTPEKLAIINKEYGTESSRRIEKIFLGYDFPKNMNYKT
jgi:hypothetical protein